MFVEHAKNYMEVEPKLPPPIYAPEVAANAILYAAENFKRDIFVGGAARFVSASAYHAPRVMDSLMKRFGFSQQKTNRPPRDKNQHSLYSPGTDLQERQGYEGHVFESSVYTQAVTHPKTMMTLLAAGLAFAAWWNLRERGSDIRLRGHYAPRRNVSGFSF
jgi:hypothetical protein